MDATDQTDVQDSPDSSPDAEILGVEVVLSIGAIMLGAGSSTSDIEHAMRATAAAVGLARTTAVISFNIISLSYVPGPSMRPITAIRFVPERTDDYQRLTAATSLVDDLRTGKIDVQRAAAEVDRISTSTVIRPGSLKGLAQAASAAAFAVVFGGTAIDAVATLLISAIVQPFVMRLDRSDLPPFFRSVIGPLISALIVAAAVAFGTPINPALVLAGSMLQFLPGAALVAGMRDLVDRSIISGSARLAEALLIGAAVAAGTAIGIGIARQFDVALDVGMATSDHGQAPIQVLAAAIACGTWAMSLGGRRLTLLTASTLGAAGWFAFISTTQLEVGTTTATALAGLVIGSGSQLLTRHPDAPIVLRVVPATYPLLPGLLIVNAMLSTDTVDGIVQLTTAATTALALGAAIAFGDILVHSFRHVRGGSETMPVSHHAPVVRAAQTVIRFRDDGHGAP